MVIKINNINLKYGNNIIFEDTKLEIPENKIAMVLGLNGTGKTTLLKILKQEIKAGCIIENLTQNIFYLPQKIEYIEGLTVFEYLSSIFYKNSLKWFLNKKEEEKIDEVLIQIGLQDKKNIKIEKLSAGELQQINIAFGLLSNAKLMLLDEPTSNLDLVNQVKILDMIKKLSSLGITIVIVMHDLKLASKYGDYFVGISGYKIIQGEKEDFIKKEILDQIYGLDFEVVKDEKNTVSFNY